MCRACGSSSIGVFQRRRLLWQCKDCGQADLGHGRHGDARDAHAVDVCGSGRRIWSPPTRRGSRPCSCSASSGISRYETAWLILHKLRRAMVAPEREPLDATRSRSTSSRSAAASTGRQAAGASATARRRSSASRSRSAAAGSGRLRLAGAGRLASSDSLEAFVKRRPSPGRDRRTPTAGAATSDCAERGYDHRPCNKQRCGLPDDQFVLPRAHRAISNLKAWLHGTHRGVSTEHLPVYLDEFVFRHNRRRTPLAAFQTLLGLSTVHAPTTLRPNHRTGPNGTNRIGMSGVIGEHPAADPAKRQRPVPDVPTSSGVSWPGNTCLCGKGRRSLRRPRRSRPRRKEPARRGVRSHDMEP